MHGIFIIISEKETIAKTTCMIPNNSLAVNIGPYSTIWHQLRILFGCNQVTSRSRSYFANCDRNHATVTGNHKFVTIPFLDVQDSQSRRNPFTHIFHSIGWLIWLGLNARDEHLSPPEME